MESPQKPLHAISGSNAKDLDPLTAAKARWRVRAHKESETFRKIMESLPEPEGQILPQTEED